MSMETGERGIMVQTIRANFNVLNNLYQAFGFQFLDVVVPCAKGFCNADHFIAGDQFRVGIDHQGTDSIFVNSLSQTAQFLEDCTPAFQRDICISIGDHHEKRIDMRIFDSLHLYGSPGFQQAVSERGCPAGGKTA